MYSKYRRRIRGRIAFMLLLLAVMASLVVQAYVSTPTVPWQAVTVGLAFGLLLGAALFQLIDASVDLSRLRKERDNYITHLERKSY